MALQFGTIQSAAFERFAPGVWAIGVSMSFSLISMLGILASRFANPDSPFNKAREAEKKRQQQYS